MATLNARPRTRSGKGGARQLRREGLIPAIMYGHGDEPRSLAVEAHDLARLLGGINAESTIIDLTVEGEAPTQALIREIQYHPARPEVLHVDFFHVHAGEKITVEVVLTMRLLYMQIMPGQDGGPGRYVTNRVPVEREVVLA